MDWATVWTVTPEIFLLLMASTLYIASACFGPRRLWAPLALGAVGVATLLAWWGADSDIRPDPGRSAVVLDSLSILVKMLALASGAAMILMAWAQEESSEGGEYFAGLLLVATGLSLAGSAHDIVLVFVSLELISLSTYVLLYLARQDLLANEAVAKYFYLSILSSAVFLFGAALFYGITATTNLSAAREWLLDPSRVASPVPPVAVAGLVLILGGLAFKMAAVPFHFYAPDVCQGTTNTLAALLLWFPKAAAFVVALRMLVFAMPVTHMHGAWITWVLAVATVVLGNLLALLQDHLRRLLAYSSIAHAGYMLIGLGASFLGAPPGATFHGPSSVALYAIAYGLMTLGFFSLLAAYGDRERPLELLEDLAGLGQRAPWAAATAAILLLSFIGLPFTAGFWGKFAVFYAALASRDQRYVVLTVIGLITAAIGAFYYLRLVALLYLRAPFTAVGKCRSRTAFAVSVACAALTLSIGLWPSGAVRVAHKAGSAIEEILKSPSAATRPDRVNRPMGAELFVSRAMDP